MREETTSEAEENWYMWLPRTKQRVSRKRVVSTLSNIFEGSVISGLRREIWIWQGLKF
jgi:hypothetical protein